MFYNFADCRSLSMKIVSGMNNKGNFLNAIGCLMRAFSFK